jgi:hypothetical protein
MQRRIRRRAGAAVRTDRGDCVLAMGKRGRSDRGDEHAGCEGPSDAGIRRKRQKKEKKSLASKHRKREKKRKKEKRRHKHASKKSQRKKKSRKHRRGSSGNDSDTTSSSDDGSTSEAEDTAEIEEWKRVWKPSGGEPGASPGRVKQAVAALEPVTEAEKSRRQAEREAAGIRNMRRGEKVPRAPKPSAVELVERAAAFQASEDAKMETFRRMLGQQPSQAQQEMAALAQQSAKKATASLPFSRGPAATAGPSRSQRQLDAFGELRNFKGQLK